MAQGCAFFGPLSGPTVSQQMPVGHQLSFADALVEPLPQTTAASQGAASIAHIVNAASEIERDDERDDERVLPEAALSTKLSRLYKCNQDGGYIVPVIQVNLAELLTRMGWEQLLRGIEKDQQAGLYVKKVDAPADPDIDRLFLPHTALVALSGMRVDLANRDVKVFLQRYENADILARCTKIASHNPNVSSLKFVL